MSAILPEVSIKHPGPPSPKPHPAEFVRAATEISGQSPHRVLGLGFRVQGLGFGVSLIVPSASIRVKRRQALSHGVSAALGRGHDAPVPFKV